MGHIVREKITWRKTKISKIMQRLLVLSNQKDGVKKNIITLVLKTSKNIKLLLTVA